MKVSKSYIRIIALIVALGGFLMGFDASVISGVVKFLEPEFGLTKLELGWAVSSLTLTATIAMLLAGPLSDRFGRRKMLSIAAVFYAVSAIFSALAPSFVALVLARMVGGFGVGASLIIAPMYIAEIAPAKLRGQLVSFNQLNIVVGISVAFFTNYLILQLSKSDLTWAQNLKFDEYTWRWMLGLETLPAIVYFLALFYVPRSPRWLILKGRDEEALLVMGRASGPERASEALAEVKKSISEETGKEKVPLKELLKPSLRFVLTIGLVIGILQQITGINSVFFYAPMIFEQSGIGTDASFSQAIYVGIINLVFTIVAILLVDKLGRKPLLAIGVAGIALSMFLLSYSFSSATYTLTPEATVQLPEQIDRDELARIENITYYSDIEYKAALSDVLGEQVAKEYESDLIRHAISGNAIMILIGILGFVAFFAVSIGPVMWVLFSELFPNRVRGLAISVVGVVNSAVSFSVQLVFPWELSVLGTGVTFLLYGVFAAIGLVFILLKVPETKGKSLEELEQILVRNKKIRVR